MNILPFEQQHPECQAREIRKQRGPLLVEADIAINKALDKGEDTTALRVYRQALRDITTTFAGDLANVTWPVKP
jgi:Phage tail assembly chaperone protein